MPTPREERIQQIHQQLDQKLLHAQQGNYSYESDLLELNQYLADAEQYGILDEIKATILNSRGALHGIAGNYSKAQKDFYAAYEHHKEQGNLYDALISLRNYAVSKRTEGDYEQARQIIHWVYSQMLSSGLFLPEVVLIQAEVQYYMKQYDAVIRAAEHLVNRKQQYLDPNREWVYLTAISVVYLLLARIAMRQGDLSQAQYMIDSANVYIPANFAKMYAGFARFTSGIFEYLSGHLEQTQKQLQLARQFVEESHAPTQIARFYITAAHELHEFGLSHEAKELTEISLAEFEKRNMLLDIRRTHEFLAILNSA
jgi:tetratricopeptide (TPR) repeat protein